MTKLHSVSCIFSSDPSIFCRISGVEVSSTLRPGQTRVDFLLVVLFVAAMLSFGSPESDEMLHFF